MLQHFIGYWKGETWLLGQRTKKISQFMLLSQLWKMTFWEHLYTVSVLDVKLSHDKWKVRVGSCVELSSYYYSVTNPLLGVLGSILRRCLKIASKGNCANTAIRSFSWISIQLVSGSSSWKESIWNNTKQLLLMAHRNPYFKWEADWIYGQYCQ